MSKKFTDMTGAEFRAMRIAKGYETQGDLAEVIGYSQQAVSCFERPGRLVPQRAVRLLRQAKHRSRRDKNSTGNRDEKTNEGTTSNTANPR